MRRALVKPGALLKTVPSGTARNAWCLRSMNAGSLSDAAETHAGCVE